MTPQLAQTRLPLLHLLSLRGQPYTLKDHFYFEPLFKVRKPRRTLLMCGRQVAKTTSIAADGTLLAASTPYMRLFYLAPRFDQVTRISSNYVRPFILESPLRQLLVDTTCTQAVLQREMLNKSVMYFSFAFLDSERVRGIAADVEYLDECQDISYDFFPIIYSCMDHSEYALTIYSGTPKTLDNGIEILWDSSSKAEWVTKCGACSSWNMAGIHDDLMKMIGENTVICARCKSPINPRTGHWYHTQGKDHPDFPGYHVPQVIVPHHYENPERWHALHVKMNGGLGYSKQRFYNEVLGVSTDFGLKLITLTDIKAASVLGPNTEKEAIRRLRKYHYVALGVDWGGGGKEEISYTAVALVGFDTANNRCDCHYVYKFGAGTPKDEEVSTIIRLFKESGAVWFAHDYGGGAGQDRELLMIQSGIPLNRIMGFSYTVAPTRNLVVYQPPVRGELRGYWGLDKPRSLMLMSSALRTKHILLPDYESAKDITIDLLSLMEDRHERPGGSDVFLVRRNPKMPDDLAHALNFACESLWHSQSGGGGTSAYPNLAEVQGLVLSPQDLNFFAPPSPGIH